MTDDLRRRPFVLLVEDDRDSREMYAMGLELCGLRVALAATAAEALRLSVAEPPDIVVSDLTLPDMDGIALAGALARDPATAGVPIVALTGRSGDDDLTRAAAAGVRRVLVKPCPPDTLADAIQDILRARH